MKVTNNIHKIKVEFNVTKEIKRFVNVFIIIGEKGIYLVDSGVLGTERLLSEYLRKIGKDLLDVKGIFLTHSHPDHIGSANTIKEMTGCRIYAPIEEINWIEDIEKQFKDRPIPNFFGLVNKSTKVDYIIREEELINIEDNISIKVVKTPGHSKGSISFIYEEEGIIFTGDSIPIVGDIPIYGCYKDSLDTLEKIERLNNIKLYCSAWDEILDSKEGLRKINEAKKLLTNIKERINEVTISIGYSDKELVFNTVCELMNLRQLSSNPLFKVSIYSTLEEIIKR